MTSREQSCSAVLLVVLLAGLLLTAGGCSSYPEVSSAESQQFIKQVYTACNTQNAERLRKCDERLMELVEAKLVTDREQAAFQRILDSAKSGDWETAQAKALDFAQRQVR